MQYVNLYHCTRMHCIHCNVASAFLFCFLEQLAQVECEQQIAQFTATIHWHRVLWNIKWIERKR